MIYSRWKQNFAKPGTFWGNSLVFQKMEKHHRPLQEFAMQHFNIPRQGKILDIGCGGGVFIAEMLKRAPKASFCGVDHSPLSVKKSRAYNCKAVKSGNVTIVEGSVSSLPLRDGEFDVATASETVYFWPDIVNDFREVHRILKPGGDFVICCDTCDREAAKKNIDMIKGMSVYSIEELVDFLNQAGFRDSVQHYDPQSGMICVIGSKEALKS